MKYLKRYSMSQYICRLLTALCFVLLVTYAFNPEQFYNKTFYDGINFSIFLLATTGLFIGLYFVPWDKLIACILLVNITAYFTMVTSAVMDNWFTFGLCLVLCMAVYYFDFGSIRFQPPKWSLWVNVALLTIAYTAILGVVCCWYYWDYWSSTYDFGIFSQMFHYMKECGEMLTTCERDGLLSHFAVHFSPIYYLLLPIYWLLPTPETLMFACAAVVASGIIPLVLLCRKFNLSVYCCIAFSVIYLLYPGFMGGLLYPIHENCFLVTLLLWFFYFVEKEKTIPACIFALLTMTVKEDAPIYIAVATVYFIITDKSRIMNGLLLLFSVLYFLTVTQYLTSYGEGVMDDMRYGDYIYDDGGLFTAIKSLIQNPVFAIKQIFKAEKILYILKMLVPLCFLPVAIKKPARLLLLIPLIIINLMSNYPYQADVGFQYGFGTGAFLFYLAVINYAEMGNKRNKAIVCGTLCAVIVFFGGHYGKFKYYHTHQNYESTRQTISIALELIPGDASVSASTYFVPNLSQRDVIYDLNYTEHETEYVAIDLRTTKPEVLRKYLNESFETICYKEGVVAIFRNLNYKGA